MFCKAILLVLTLVAAGWLAIWVYVQVWVHVISYVGVDPPWVMGYTKHSVILGTYTSSGSSLNAPTRAQYRGFLGFGSLSQSWGTGRSSAIVIPYWLLVAASGAYPSLVFIGGPLRRHRRRKRGLCVKCGYDLTGNVSGVCSECGTTVDDLQSRHGA